MQGGVYSLAVPDHDALRAIPDPVERIHAVNAAIQELTTEVAELSTITRDAVREMRQTMSYGDVARALGVSRTRIQQLER